MCIFYFVLHALHLQLARYLKNKRTVISEPRTCRLSTMNVHVNKILHLKAVYSINLKKPWSCVSRFSTNYCIWLFERRSHLHQFQLPKVAAHHIFSFLGTPTGNKKTKTRIHFSLSVALSHNLSYCSFLQPSIISKVLAYTVLPQIRGLYFFAGQAGVAGLVLSSFQRVRLRLNVFTWTRFSSLGPRCINKRPAIFLQITPPLFLSFVRTLMWNLCLILYSFTTVLNSYKELNCIPAWNCGFCILVTVLNSLRSLLPFLLHQRMSRKTLHHLLQIIEPVFLAGAYLSLDLHQYFLQTVHHCAVCNRCQYYPYCCPPQCHPPLCFFPYYCYH